MINASDGVWVRSLNFGNKKTQQKLEMLIKNLQKNLILKL